MKSTLARQLLYESLNYSLSFKILLECSSEFLFNLVFNLSSPALTFFIIGGVDDDWLLTMRRLCRIGRLRAGEQDLLAGGLVSCGFWHAPQHIILAIVVAFEELLDTVPTQLGLTFFDSLSVFPLLIVHMIRIEIVNMDVWHVLRLHLPGSKGLPTEVVKPGMGLELVCATLIADSIHRFPLQALVDEIGSSLIPPCWYVSLLDLDLSKQDLVPDILSRASFIRPLAHHALICDDTHSEVVRSQSMVLPAHNLWGHVAGSTTCLTGVVRGEDPCDTEVR